MYHFNVHFPLTKIKVNANCKSWITDSIRNKKATLVSLSAQARDNKDDDTKEMLKCKRKELKQNVMLEKKKFFDRKIECSTNLIKSTWQIINNKLGRKLTGNNSELLLNVNGRQISDPLCMAEVFNSFFSSAVENLILPNLPDNLILNENSQSIHFQVNKSFYLQPVNADVVSAIITSLSNKFSSGHDDISTAILKQCGKVISGPLAHLINSSFVTGIFPDQMKIAKVIPVFKKGDPHDVSCYRPISLLSSFSKVYERVVYNQFVSYLESNCLFDKEQHGFRSGKSVITAATDIVQSIIENVDKKKKVAAIFLNLSRAFDSVSHPKLLQILENFNIDRLTAAWFKSYLTNRKQYVEILKQNGKQVNKFQSSQRLIKYGVPQGSILGPLLFVCYLKGLPSVVMGNGKVCLYADDTNLLVTEDDIKQLDIIIS
uniref:Reverse transcriptase domain-containing protein n=1 Tax=Graphocephala atropunctata TaxID=36148 RepID=A0A1B6LDB0_9HEMI